MNYLFQIFSGRPLIRNSVDEVLEKYRSQQLGSKQRKKAELQLMKLKRPEYLPGMIPPDVLQDFLNLTKDTVSTLFRIKQKRSAMSQQENKSLQWDDIKVCEFYGFAQAKNMEGVYHVGEILDSFKEIRYPEKAPIPEEKPSVKPPIGIMPEWLWKEQRLKEVMEAIERYQNRLLDIPSELKEEEAALTSWLTKREAKKPLEEKPVLFTTEDGKKLFEGDEYWIVLEPEYNYEIVKCTCGNVGISLDRPGVRHFSTEEAANSWILWNKPCLSMTEVISASVLIPVSMNRDYPKDISYFFTIPELTKLAKAKIKGGEGI